MKSDSRILKHVVIVCPGLGGMGAVADVAAHHARELAITFPVTLVSDALPKTKIPGVATLDLKPFRFGSLRRFAHVPNELAFSLAARSAIAKLHTHQPVALVICHGHPVAALAARHLQRRLQIPYALVTHGDIFDRPKGTYDSRLTWFYQRMTPAAYRDADLVLALSPYMETLAIRGGAEPTRVMLAPNGIDAADIGLDDSEPQWPEQEAARLELLYVGRLSIEKGVDVLIEAAAILRSRAINFRLRVVGTGVDAQRLRALNAQKQLGQFVQFIGSMPRVDLGALYRSADVLCVPSRSEPFGVVVLEAMAAGTAAVVTDTGGLPYLIDDGVSGIVCRVADPDSLADSIGRFASDRALARRMGAAGRRRAATEFSWARIGKLLGNAVNAVSIDRGDR